MAILPIEHALAVVAMLNQMSDDRRAIDNAEAKDVVVVWKAFLEEC